MTDWLFTWKAWVVGAIILLATVALAFAFRDEAPLANITSIVGLAVSILGFVVTIWTVIDARQQIKDAGDRAEGAIVQASAEARRAVEGIGDQLLAADCALLRSGVEDLRQAAQDTRWPRAVYRCQECRLIAIRLANDPHLTAEEVLAMGAAANDFQLILRFIERNRLTGQPGLLQDGHMRTLDEVIGLLARLQARLHHESLRLTETTSQNQ